MTARSPLLLLLLMTLCASSGRAAHAQSDPEGFFEPDFATREFNDGKSAPAERKQPAPASPAPTPSRPKSETELATEAAILRFRESGASGGAPAQKRILPGAPLGTVSAVGAILHGGDTKHVQRFFKELIKLTADGRIGAGKVYVTIGTHNLEPRDKAIWRLRGGTLGVHLKVPEKYKAITISPTWILFTKEGEVLLEGVEDISRYLTPEGKIIEPATPTPTPLVEGGEPLIAPTPAAQRDTGIIPGF